MNDFQSSGRDIPATNMRMLLGEVRRQFGDEGVRDVVERAGDDRPISVLLEGEWSTYDHFQRLLESAFEVLGNFDGLGLHADMGSGATPEIATMLRKSYETPIGFFEATSVGGGPLPAVMDVTVEIVSPTHIRTRRRMRDGFQPYAALCSYVNGLSPFVPRLFGLPVVEARETACVLDGAPECVYELRWDDAQDLAHELDRARSSLEMAERRLESFQATVADILAADEVDGVLGRIVNTASHATRAPGVMLVVDGIDGRTRCYAEGISAGDANRQLEQGMPHFSVDVASTRRHYGRFVCFDPARSLGYETAAIEPWARLAATALDSAFALEEARRQAATANALLELSTSLAELASPGELASKIVRAMPAVIDCDCSAVMLATDGLLRIAAHHGFTPEGIAAIEALDLTVDPRGQEELVVHTLDAAPAPAERFMTATGLEAMASSPITVEGAGIIGYLVAAVRSHPERVVGDSRLAERFAGLAGQAAVALRNGRLVDHIRHQSLHDSLTDLPNRALILDRAEQMLARARRNRSAIAALFLDLDGFKDINDTLGHGAGDELLQMVAARLRTAVRASDTVGRLGGDEFVVLADGESLAAGAEVVAERLLDVLREPFLLSQSDRLLTVGSSIGIAIGDRRTAGELLRDADIALYSAKAAGKGCYRLFAPEMQDEVRARAELAEGLVNAGRNNEFFLLYQPIFDLQAEEATGVEALLRWQHPVRGVVAPDDFIPLLEETGQIVEVGRWVLGEACRQTAAWHASGHPIDVSVNASIRQLERSDFVDDVRSALETSGLPPASLIVEITETAIMHDAATTIAVLTALKQLGVRIAIDDFGTGYSSLAYLRQFPVDALKIDRSFIDAVADSPAAAELIHTLVRLGKALALETFAEGIEHRAQLDRLQVEGCDSGQGFMFARPLPASSLGAFLAEHRTGIPAGR